MIKFRYRLVTVLLLLVVLMTSGCRDNNSNDTNIQTGVALAEAFPLLYIQSGEFSYNYMQGYELKMDQNSMYGALVTANNEEPITFTIDEENSELVRVEYVLYDKSGKTIENGTVADSDIGAGGAFDICLNNLSDEEAQLEMKLCFGETSIAYYYIRVIGAEGIQKELQYIMDIENACLEKESPVDLTLSLEWDLVTNSDSYYETDINSSYDQATWGGLNIADCAGDYYINLVDWSEGITSFSVDYIVYSEDEYKTYYRVSDFLRVREVNGEMYLLNFHRNTEELFSENEGAFDTSTLYLGVGSGNEDYASYENGKQLFFIQNQALYYFDVESNRLSSVYKSNTANWQNGLIDINKNGIHLLKKEGQYFYFIVSGYLSDSVHSGACGISIMRYDMEKNTTEELFFQPVKYNYELVIDELDMLSYMNDEGSIFFVSNGEIRSYNVETNVLKDEIKNISLDSLVVSPEGEYIGWSKKQDGGEDILAVKNLNTGDELTISPKDGTRISPIGFVKNDFVYGVSDSAEVDSGAATDKQLLMYNICIVDNEGELIKEYPQDGKRRVLSGETSDTVIVLNIGEKSEQGTFYKEVDQQQIVSGNKTENSFVEKKEIQLTDKGNVWAFVFEASFKGAPSFLPASYNTESVIEKIAVEPSEISTYYKDKYFLYARGRLYGTYKIMREAVVLAADMAGVVKDIDNNKLYYRIAKSKTANALPQDKSLAAMLLKSEEGVVEAWREDVDDLYVLDITGMTPEDMLQFVSKGFSVLARYNAETFVWVIGYTDKTVKCQKSASDEIFEISMEKAEEIFAKTGYEYYTCND